MITNAVLGVLSNVVAFLLSPLQAFDFVLDLADKIPVVTNFLKLGIYILPWDSLVPLFVIVAGLGLFRLVIAIIKTIMNVIPFA